MLKNSFFQPLHTLNPMHCQNPQNPTTMSNLTQKTATFSFSSIKPRENWSSLRDIFKELELLLAAPSNLARPFAQIRRLLRRSFESSHFLREINVKQLRNLCETLFAQNSEQWSRLCGEFSAKSSAICERSQEISWRRPLRLAALVLCANPRARTLELFCADIEKGSWVCSETFEFGCSEEEAQEEAARRNSELAEEAANKKKTKKNARNCNKIIEKVSFSEKARAFLAQSSVFAEKVAEFMEKVRETHRNVVFLLDEKLMKTANINEDVTLKTRMCEKKLVFLQFFEGKAFNWKNLNMKSGYSFVRTMNSRQPHILTNSHEKLMEIIEKKQENERFDDVFSMLYRFLSVKNRVFADFGYKFKETREKQEILKALSFVLMKFSEKKTRKSARFQRNREFFMNLV